MQRLSDEVRAVIEAMATQDLDDDDIAEAAELVAQARRMLVGPQRDRWFGGGSSYVDFSPFSGRLSPVAPPMRVRDADGNGDPAGHRLLADARLSSVYEGPPGGVHGGVLAGMFDELLGWLQQFVGVEAVTGTLRVAYRRLTPIDTDLTLHAWVAEDKGRRIVTRGECQVDGKVTAEAEAVFVRVEFAAL